MTGNSITPQILGASTVGGVSLAILPSTGNQLFSSILIGVIIVAALVIVSRLVKLFSSN